ncbi:MAG: hypothetical protein HQM04_04810 [Magnetococcales bacterium]|nr:hypothetical protein [Magnetococcales bacterium]MBF0114346.1 hypothetical protein [Magnetococcales bacterium]
MSTGSQVLVQERQTMRVVYLIGVVALLFLCCLALLGRFVLDVERLQPQIVATLEKVTGRTVSLDGVYFAPTEGFFALELRNLQIHADADSEPPLLVAKKVQIGLAPFSLFRHGMNEEAPLDISSLTLFSPQLQLVRQEDEWLVQQLQEMIVQGDLQMKHHLGWGMTRLSFNSIKIQNGIVTLLNWEQASSQAVIIDRIYGEIHALSAEKASPVTLSARFHSIPFTLTGQMGPLPDSLDLTAMPILLNLEAKSTGLLQFIDYFANVFGLVASPMQKVALPEQWDIRGARGYFFTLFNGSLKKGIQTRSRLELDKLVIANRRESGRGEGQAGRLLVAANDRSGLGLGREPLPIDLAFRQKSMIKLEESDNRPLLWIEEGFLYADGRPLLDVKGVWRGVSPSDEEENAAMLDMTVTTLSSFDLRRFAHLLAPYVSGDTPQGVIRLEGGWPNSIHWSGHLDWTHTDLSLPAGPQVRSLAPRRSWQSLFAVLGMDKRGGVPLILDWDFEHDHADEVEEVWRVKELAISRPATAPDKGESRLRLSGALLPQLDVEVSGEWELAQFKDYLQLAANWDVAGLMQIDLALRGDGLRLSNRDRWVNSLSGQVQVDSGQLAGIALQDVVLRLGQERGVLRLQDIEASVGMGRLNAQAWLENGGDEWRYHALFSFVGVALEKLSGRQGGYVGLSTVTRRGRGGATPVNRPVAWRPLLEGIAFGDGEVWGGLNQEWLFKGPVAGRMHLQVEPGRMLGLNGDLFLRPPGDPQRLFGMDRGEAVEEGGDKAGVVVSGVGKPFYWDRLQADLRWDVDKVTIDPFLVQAGGLRLQGSGERRASGQHGFDVQITSPLWDDAAPFRARLEGDLQQTLYRSDKVLP